MAACAARHASGAWAPLGRRVAASVRGMASTSQVRAGHEVDVPALVAYLAQHVPRIAWEGVTLKQFTFGQSNPTYLLQTVDGKRIVLRKQPPGKLLRGAHAVDREFAVMSALHGIVPVPSPLHLCEDTSLLGTKFFLYTFVEGQHHGDTIAGSLTGRQRATALHSMAETLAAIHCVDPTAVNMQSFGSKPELFVGRQVKVWTAQYNASATGDTAMMDGLGQYLASVVPGGFLDDGQGPPTSASIVHGDYTLGNCVLHPEAHTVAGVLDWELSTLGHPLLDLAHNALPFYIPHTPGQAITGYPKDANGRPSLEGIPSTSEYLQWYLNAVSVQCAGTMGCGMQRSIAVDAGDAAPRHWDFFVALASFRAAAILQGVYKRAQQGNASAANAASVGQLAATFAEVGAERAAAHKAAGMPRRVPVKGAAVPDAAGGSGGPGPSHAVHQQRSAEETLCAVQSFMAEHVLPAEQTILHHGYSKLVACDSQHAHPQLEELKAKAREAGLWNLFLPPAALQRVQVTFNDLPHDTQSELGLGVGGSGPVQVAPGFTNAQYASMAEAMGQSLVGPEVFNCSAPDTGNMEVLAMYGSRAQQEQWLLPLLAGTIRSCFGMTEPAVASCDATNMQATVRQQGDGSLLLNGRKWWTSGGSDPRAAFMIFMGLAEEAVAAGAPPHARHSMVIVPMDAPGVRVERALPVFGYDDAPHGHVEVVLDNVVVPADNLLLGSGRGFEIAQGRLGPGRIHHCMRLIGAAERAVRLAAQRATTRVAFGSPIADKGAFRQALASARCKVDQARLLTLAAAEGVDAGGAKSAARLISQIKAVAPTMACEVLDWAMQVHGGAGVSNDTPLAHLYAAARALRLADGPDEVHLESIAKLELREAAARQAAAERR